MRIDWKKLGSNVAGVIIGVSAIVHSLPPDVVEQFHVPELLAVLAAVLGGWQKSFVVTPAPAAVPADPFVR